MQQRPSELVGGLLALMALLGSAAAPAAELRARDLGVSFDGTPGALNAITDVAGIEVGFKTLIRGSGPLVVDKGQVRTSDGELCYPPTIADQYSRYLLRCQALRSVRTAETRPVLERLVRELGLTRAIRTDNGMPFALDLGNHHREAALQLEPQKG